MTEVELGWERSDGIGPGITRGWPVGMSGAWRFHPWWIRRERGLSCLTERGPASRRSSRVLRGFLGEAQPVGPSAVCGTACFREIVHLSGVTAPPRHPSLFLDGPRKLQRNPQGAQEHDLEPHGNVTPASFTRRSPLGLCGATSVSCPTLALAVWVGGG